MIAGKPILTDAHDTVDQLRQPNHLRTTLARTVERGWSLVTDTLSSPESRQRLLWVVLAVAGTTALMLPVRERPGVLNELLIFLLSDVCRCAHPGIRTSDAGGVLSFLAFDFLFIPPYHTLSVAKATMSWPSSSISGSPS